MMTTATCPVSDARIAAMAQAMTDALQTDVDAYFDLVRAMALALSVEDRIRFERLWVGATNR